MLIAIVLYLAALKDEVLPTALGRANYAAVLARMGQVDPALAQTLHDSDGPKPLTCSGVLNAPHGAEMRVQRGDILRVRVTGLTPAVSDCLQTCLLDKPPDIWELNYRPFAVAKPVCDAGEDDWSGRTTSDELAHRYLLGSAPLDNRVILDFVTPTSFKSKGMNMPLPLPGLVFGSLVDKWNAVSALVFREEVRQFADEKIAVSRFDLHSRAPMQKNAAVRIGSVGRVTYTALAQERYWLAAMQTVADFAFYSGVGVQTSTGMGQVRRVN